jgi:hypothetical protein
MYKYDFVCPIEYILFTQTIWHFDWTTFIAIMLNISCNVHLGVNNWCVLVYDCNNWRVLVYDCNDQIRSLKVLKS